MLTGIKGVAFLLGAALVFTVGFFVVLWPTIAFPGNAGGVGWILWAVICAGIGAIVAFARRSDRMEFENRKQQFAIEDADPVHHADEQSVFRSKVKSSFEDTRIVGYFRRGLVHAEQIADSLVYGSAFQQALKMESYEDFAHNRDERDVAAEANEEILEEGTFDRKPMAAMLAALLLVSLLFTEISKTNALTSGLAFIPFLLEAVFGFLLVGVVTSPSHRPLKVFLLIITISAWVFSIISIPVLANVHWSFLFLIISILIFVLECLLLTGQTWEQFPWIFAFLGRAISIAVLFQPRTQQSQDRWLQDCVENIIMPQAVLAINTALGEDKDRLLVAQDSEGLRRLQDPNFTVSTKSEHRIESVLSQMDGGSIAVSGPRGAGKSTLLKRFSGLQGEMNQEHCICIYLTAPAEYIPKDFIAELFQRLCEAYLVYVGSPLPDKIYKERPPLRLRSALGRTVKVLWLCFRTIVAAALVIWMLRSFAHIHYKQVYFSMTHEVSRWYNWGDRSYARIHNDVKPGWLWTLGEIVALSLIAFLFLPRPSRWRRYVKRHREPVLAKKAREQLLRLQIDKTVTWGTGMNSPALRGASLSFNRGGSASYAPWTLPELVGHMRRFMQEISEQFTESRHAVIVGIDEIDRIGSLDHAEKFIGEIKTIFGVQKCFFLVAVAEDVGSVFAQRATAGRSILENAFDDVVAVEPLNFEEARDLLLKRVPGFTDSFVYLAHALSGGLPRELIRVTRRLVEINGELSTDGHHARLENLAVAIIKEEVIEAIRATRNQMSRLTLHAQWTPFFEKLRSASISLRLASAFVVAEAHACIKELSELLPPEAPEGVPTARSLVMRDEDEAKRIVRDFAAFSYFGLTVVDAFTDRSFDLRRVQQLTGSATGGSYEELAIARAELSFSTENARAMIARFRSSLVSGLAR